MNPKRNQKRQRAGKATNTSDNKHDHHALIEGAASQQSEPKKEGGKFEYTQDPPSMEEGFVDPQQRSGEEDRKSKRGRTIQSFTSPQFEDTLKTREIFTDVKQRQQEVPSNKGETEREVPKEREL